MRDAKKEYLTRNRNNNKKKIKRQTRRMIKVIISLFEHGECVRMYVTIDI